MTNHEHCWHERVDASPLCCHCEDLPHEMIVAAATERVKNKAQQEGFRDWAISHLLNRAQECNAAAVASDHGDPFLSAKAIAFSQAARELEQRCAPAERTEVAGEQPTASGIYYEGLDRIWRLLDLKMERQPSDITTLQRVAHDYMVRGNALRHTEESIIDRARRLAVELSGDADSTGEVKTLKDAWQIIEGVIKNKVGHNAK